MRHIAQHRTLFIFLASMLVAGLLTIAGQSAPYDSQGHDTYSAADAVATLFPACEGQHWPNFDAECESEIAQTY